MGLPGTSRRAQTVLRNGRHGLFRPLSPGPVVRVHPDAEGLRLRGERKTEAGRHFQSPSTGASNPHSLSVTCWSPRSEEPGHSCVIRVLSFCGPQSRSSLKQRLPFLRGLLPASYSPASCSVSRHRASSSLYMSVGAQPTFMVWAAF